MKKRILPLLLLLLAIGSVAALGCFAVEKWFDRCACQSRQDGDSWIHRKLGISAEQEKRLQPIEERYAEQKRHSEEMMRLANRELAQAILEDKQDSERVHEAVDKIHHAMGGLQKATLNHIFEMKEVLTADQYDKLLQMTAEGLREISTP